MFKPGHFFQAWIIHLRLLPTVSQLRVGYHVNYGRIKRQQGNEEARKGKKGATRQHVKEKRQRVIYVLKKGKVA